VTIAVDVRDLVGHPGSSRNVHVEELIEGLRTELAQVAGESPVDADLLLESVLEGVLASGEVAGTYTETCARCLTPVERPFRLRVQELFAPDAAPDDPDGYPLTQGEIDLEPLIRDAVLLAMPYSPLCKPDCLGICERCGGNRNLGECACEPEADDRWAALSAIEFPLETNGDQG
jgi:uncharacterized protein